MSSSGGKGLNLNAFEIRSHSEVGTQAKTSVSVTFLICVASVQKLYTPRQMKCFPWEGAVHSALLVASPVTVFQGIVLYRKTDTEFPC